MIQPEVCPICYSENTNSFLEAKDHTVTHETFIIKKCNGCTGMYTSNAPAADHIGAYYKAEAYISHTDTQEGLINKLYHVVRSFTLLSKSNLIKKFAVPTGKNILDIGAGTGAFLNKMKTKGWAVTGLEPDDTARNIALENYGLHHANPEMLFHLEEKTFQAVTMWHVLEHVHTLHEYLVQINKLLVKGGILVIAVPNYTSYDAQKYKEYWAAYDVPRHLYHFSPKAMQQVVEQKGFTFVKASPMWFDSFYVSMLSEQYRSGRSNIFSAVITGMISNIKALFNTKKCSSLIYVFRKA